MRLLARCNVSQKYTMCVGATNGVSVNSVCINDEATCMRGIQGARSDILDSGSFETSQAYWIPQCAEEVRSNLTTHSQYAHSVSDNNTDHYLAGHQSLGVADHLKLGFTHA